MSYPRETTEYQTINITINGTHTTDGIELSVVQSGARPTDWTPAEIVEGQTVYLINQMSPGIYRIWAQVTQDDTEEKPVIDCGTFRID